MADELPAWVTPPSPPAARAAGVDWFSRPIVALAVGLVVFVGLMAIQPPLVHVSETDRRISGARVFTWALVAGGLVFVLPWVIPIGSLGS